MPPVNTWKKLERPAAMAMTIAIARPPTKVMPHDFRSMRMPSTTSSENRPSQEKAR